MHGAATAIVPHSSLVRRSRPVYVTLDCKCWFAHELHFSAVVAAFTPKAPVAKSEESLRLRRITAVSIS